MNFRIIRTTSEHPDFRKLVSELDQALAIINGDANDFFAQYNKIDLIQHVVVAYHNDQPAGCGAFKPFDEQSVEIKRMYVPIEMRRKGIAQYVLSELEKWSHELGFTRCVLETGKTMREANALYEKCGYSVIENYGQYVGVESSVCFAKTLDVRL
jgi:GNAT superfamily N-acetyltransferase